jgi:hypothetical protein
VERQIVYYMVKGGVPQVSHSLDPEDFLVVRLEVKIVPHDFGRDPFRDFHPLCFGSLHLIENLSD